MNYPRDDGPFSWWDEEDEHRPDEPQTRGPEHPDGFSFLRPPSGKFWDVWLQFTSEEIARLNYLRWMYQNRFEEVSSGHQRSG